MTDTPSQMPDEVIENLKNALSTCRKYKSSLQQGRVESDFYSVEKDILDAITSYKNTRAASVPSEGTIHSVGIDALIADAMKKEMSPDDIEQQRQSWIRGQTGCDETTTVQPPSDKERAEALRWASEICMQSDKTAPSMRKSNQHLNQIYATIERALTAPDQSDTIKALDYKSLLIDNLFFRLSTDDYQKNALIEEVLLKAAEFLTAQQALALAEKGNK